MIARALVAVALALLSLLSAAEDRPAIPSEFVAAVAAAERDGRILFDASSHPTAPDDPVVAAAKTRISDFCGGITYRAVVVPSQPAPIVYFLGEVAPKDGIVVGRHYKVSGDTVLASTNSCLVIPPRPNGAVASYVTHLRSPVPTEYHVYLSLKIGKPMFVGTSSGVWAVENGKVRFIKKRDGA